MTSVLKMRKLWTTTLLVLSTWGLGAAGAQANAQLNTLAANAFAAIGVQKVPCPKYTFAGGNKPVCGSSEVTGKAFAAAFDRFTESLAGFEASMDWKDDHDVWLKVFTVDGVRYAAVSNPLPKTFNTQIIALATP